MRVASLLGVSELLYDKTLTPREILEKIDQVTRDDVARVSAHLFSPERMKFAVIGPFEDPGRFAALLQE